MNRVRMDRVALVVAGVVVVLALIALVSCAYVVQPGEYAVVLQFGNPVVAREEPGLYFRLPFLQSVSRLPKRVQSWEGRRDRRTTSDKKLIYVEPWARWRITKPIQFLQVVRTVNSAHAKLDGFVDSAVGEVIASHRLIDVVRNTREQLKGAPEQEELRKLMGSNGMEEEVVETQPSGASEPEEITIGLAELVAKIREKAQEKILNPAARGEDKERLDYGFELVDVGLVRVIYVDDVLESVYARMKAERERWANAYRKNGDKRKRQIIAKADARAKKLVGAGEQAAALKRGQADAEVIGLYAEAIEKTKEFYGFLRTLDAYKESLSGQTELIFTTDSEFFTLLKDPDAGQEK